MVEFAENTGGGSEQEHDVDAIIAQAYGQQNPGAVEPSLKQETQEAPKAEVPQFKEYEFNVRGQAVKIKDNDPRFQQWLSQGHDYAQNINAFKSERQAWEQQRQHFEKQYSPYREIDEFAKQNPDWWAYVDQSYKQRLSSQPEIPDTVKSYFDQQLAPIKDDIPLMKQFLQEMQTQKIEKQQQEEDAKLNQAVKSIQEKYPDLDFSAKDESGFSLEHRVLNHAVENGFPTFRAAFFDYYHDHLEKLAEARGKESIAQEMHKRKKLGLLDENPTPTPTSQAGSILFGGSSKKPRSWNDLRSEDILKEFKFA